MKKALAAILLLIYFTVTTGFVVNLHFCMNRFDSVKIGGSKSETCGKCGMHQDENTCCWDDVKVLKITSDQLSAVVSTPVFGIDCLPITPVPFLSTPFLNDTFLFVQQDTGPPLSKQDTYLQNCVFRL